MFDHLFDNLGYRFCTLVVNMFACRTSEGMIGQDRIVVILILNWERAYRVMLKIGNSWKDELLVWLLSKKDGFIDLGELFGNVLQWEVLVLSEQIQIRSLLLLGRLIHSVSRFHRCKLIEKLFGEFSEELLEDVGWKHLSVGSIWFLIEDTH